jgi:hypothetical protein
MIKLISVVLICSALTLSAGNMKLEQEAFKLMSDQVTILESIKNKATAKAAVKKLELNMKKDKLFLAKLKKANTTRDKLIGEMMNDPKYSKKVQEMFPRMLKAMQAIPEDCKMIIGPTLKKLMSKD